jgi:hypothetical protein
MTTVKVSSPAQLLRALEHADHIEVEGSLSGMPMICLRPGVTLRGGTLRFGARGVRLSSGNLLEDVTVIVPDHEVAISNDLSVSDLGRLTLRNVRTRGQVLLLADASVRAGHVEVDGLVIEGADLRGRSDRPHGFGVDAMQGAFTLWNRQPEASARITASLASISAGSEAAPIRGSGVFIAGHGDWSGQPDGGVVRADVLRTGPVYTDGGIEPGTPDLISAGAYVLGGAEVETVLNEGPVTTFGANDMALDNWGQVGTWTARAPVTTHGPSGIGFVNFGTLDRLEVQAPVTTYGAGARGFNVYDGQVTSAHFHSLSTHADGAVGIQVSRDLPELDITEGVTTLGGRGTSLVQGVQTQLSAAAISVKPGGRIGRLGVGGSLTSHGDEVVTLDVEGMVGSISAQRVVATGAGSDAVHLSGDVTGMDDVPVTASHGHGIVRAPGSSGDSQASGQDPA